MWTPQRRLEGPDRALRSQQHLPPLGFRHPREAGLHHGRPAALGGQQQGVASPLDRVSDDSLPIEDDEHPRCCGGQLEIPQ